MLFLKLTYLASSQALKHINNATWSLKRSPAKDRCFHGNLFPKISNGSGKQVAAAIVHIASPMLKTSKALNLTSSRSQKKLLLYVL